MSRWPSSFPVGLPFNAAVDADGSAFVTASRPPKAPPTNQLLFALSESSFDDQSPLPPSLAKRPFSKDLSPTRNRSLTAVKIEHLVGLPSGLRFAGRPFEDEGRDDLNHVPTHSASTPLSGRSARGIDSELLDKVVEFARADVKRKKMEVELYVETITRNADSVEEMLRGLTGGGGCGGGGGGKGETDSLPKTAPRVHTKIVESLNRAPKGKRRKRKLLRLAKLRKRVRFV